MKNLLPILLFITLFACNKEQVAELPSDLQVEITKSEQVLGLITITATANNTSEYKLYVEDMLKEVDANTTGTFEYTFEIEGVYNIGVRAYNADGKSISQINQVTIGEEAPDNSPVPLDLGYTTPLTYAGYTLKWKDEFDGTSLKTSNWNYETGGHGWGNNELQYYQQQNASVKNGTLIIEARKESSNGRDYTSSRLTTQSKQTFTYGRIDIRALLPKGQGIWPALWMLGANISSVSWPACGEIDIMEMVGGENGRDNTSHGTVHWDDNGHAQYGDSYKLAEGIFAESYHVFSIEWTATSIKWFVDDQQFNVVNITPAHMSEFHKPQFFIVNLAVGGNWPGSPNSTTVFPQQMKVDYIRVFQKN